MCDSTTKYTVLSSQRHIPLVVLEAALEPLVGD